MDAPALTANRFDREHCPRLIVKIGSALLVGEDATVRTGWLETLVADVAQRRQDGQQIVIVSSGAVALGARLLGLSHGGRKSLDDAQAAAAAGQIALAQCWAELLGHHRINAAQILVTLGDLENRRRYLNASEALDRLLNLGAVPIVNENDSVAMAEVRFGDNDRLAARVGQASRAGGVVLLSDVEGLYTANPRRDPEAALVPLVEKIDSRILAMAGDRPGTGMGSGGMGSKLEAARIATSAGIPLAIVSGKYDHPLARFAANNSGTIFAAEKTASPRDAWLSGRLTSEGAITIDAGACAAIASGSSLLPAGATAVAGNFDRGDVVDILDPDGKAVARGMAEYDLVSAAKIIGYKTDDLGDILGYAPRSTLVHRDHMVLL